MKTKSLSIFYDIFEPIVQKSPVMLPISLESHYYNLPICLRPKLIQIDKFLPTSVQLSHVLNVTYFKIWNKCLTIGQEFHSRR